MGYEGTVLEAGGRPSLLTQMLVLVLLPVLLVLLHLSTVLFLFVARSFLSRLLFGVFSTLLFRHGFRPLFVSSAPFPPSPSPPPPPPPPSPSPFLFSGVLCRVGAALTD